MFTLTVEAFNAAEMLRVPAFVLAEEATGHLYERVDAPSEVRVFDRDYRPGEPRSTRRSSTAYRPCPTSVRVRTCS